MFLTLKNINFGYAKNDFILQNLNIEISKDEITAIIGDNGSGKTTIGKLMAGILKPNSGKVMIDGNDIKNISLGEIGKNIGYLFQEPSCQIFAPSVREELSFVMDLKEVPIDIINDKVDTMLNLFHIKHLENANTFVLSRGEKQRLALGAILINQPTFLILDEPTTGLDMMRKNSFSNIVEKLKVQGIGMVLISHDEDFVEAHADRIVELSNGRIMHDSKT